MQKAILIFTALFFVACDPIATEDSIERQSNSFLADPSESNLRELLKMRSDGAGSYFLNAHIGKTFAEHPTIYKALYESLPSEGRTRLAIEKLGKRGDLVFEYYPELEPSNFDSVYSKASWLPKITEQIGEVNR